MNHLVWRLHRNQAYLALMALVALAVILIVTGVTMANEYNAAVARCAGGCSDLADQLFRGDGAIMDLVDFTLVVPLLFGLFWGAPLLSKEFEDGTHNLAWTQGVSRPHWFRVNVLWSLLAAAAWGAAMAALVSWWRYPENALNARFDAFDVQGIVPIAYTLFTVALGIAVGSVIRRVLPSLAVTLTIFVAIRVAIGVYLRPHFMTPVAKTTSLLGQPPPGAWVLSQTMLGPAGSGVTQFPAACQTAGSPGTKGLLGQCLSTHGFRQIITYQPDSRFWAFQGIEAGIYLFLAAALIGFAAWWVLKRDA